MPARPRVHAGADLVKGILTNLLKNAAEAAGAGGSVLASRGRTTARVAIEVHDSGPGLSEEAAATLFEPTITFKEHGMGLGLSIAKTHALLSGGDIALDGRRARRRGVQGDAAGVARIHDPETARDPHAPHRHRRRRAEHRPVAAADSRGRGLPRHGLRVGRRGFRPSARKRPRRSLSAGSAPARRQRHRPAALAEAERRRDAGRHDLRTRHDPRCGGSHAQRRVRLPGKAARPRPRAARRRRTRSSDPTCSARTSASASWSATRRR